MLRSSAPGTIAASFRESGVDRFTRCYQYISTNNDAVTSTKVQILTHFAALSVGSSLHGKTVSGYNGVKNEVKAPT